MVSSARLDLSKRDTAIEVSLTEIEGGVVKATVTNTGAEDLNLLAYGSILGQYIYHGMFIEGCQALSQVIETILQLEKACKPSLSLILVCRNSIMD